MDWNDQKYCEIWRHEWEVIQNRYLEANNRPERVDLRSYARQGLDIIPTCLLYTSGSNIIDKICSITLQPDLQVEFHTSLLRAIGLDKKQLLKSVFYSTLRICLTGALIGICVGFAASTFISVSYTHLRNGDAPLHLSGNFFVVRDDN